MTWSIVRRCQWMNCQNDWENWVQERVDLRIVADIHVCELHTADALELFNQPPPDPRAPVTSVAIIGRLI